MISLLLPTRKRPTQLLRMINSARTTAAYEIEIVCYIDDDDNSYDESVREQIDEIVIGPRIRNITQAWNECFNVCSGEIVSQMNDDCVFVTPKWDRMVEAAFYEVPDKILLVHGNDVFGHGDNFGPHPFVHRKWIEALGYFIPPYFCSDFGDAWPNELADRIGRRRYVPFNIEHRHFSYGFDEMNDETTQERLQRHREDDPDSLYYSPEMSQQRVNDAKKLAALMDAKIDTSKWAPPKGRNGVLSAGKCVSCGSIMTVPVQEGKKIFCNACGLEWDRVKQ